MSSCLTIAIQKYCSSPVTFVKLFKFMKAGSWVVIFLYLCFILMDPLFFPNTFLFGLHDSLPLSVLNFNYMIWFNNSHWKNEWWRAVDSRILSCTHRASSWDSPVMLGEWFLFSLLSEVPKGQASFRISPPNGTLRGTTENATLVLTWNIGCFWPKILALPSQNVLYPPGSSIPLTCQPGPHLFWWSPEPVHIYCLHSFIFSDKCFLCFYRSFTFVSCFLLFLI